MNIRKFRCMLHIGTLVHFFTRVGIKCFWTLSLNVFIQFDYFIIFYNLNFNFSFPGFILYPTVKHIVQWTPSTSCNNQQNSALILAEKNSLHRCRVKRELTPSILSNKIHTKLHNPTYTKSSNPNPSFYENPKAKKLQNQRENPPRIKHNKTRYPENIRNRNKFEQ